MILEEMYNQHNKIFMLLNRKQKYPTIILSAVTRSFGLPIINYEDKKTKLIYICGCKTTKIFKINCNIEKKNTKQSKRQSRKIMIQCLHAKQISTKSSMTPQAGVSTALDTIIYPPFIQTFMHTLNIGKIFVKASYLEFFIRIF